ncbi:MAG: hypothetical protein J5772_02830 [Clostridia bacterium]|nr:hypothetical protein [Clostridia bacterium]
MKLVSRLCAALLAVLTLLCLASCKARKPSPAEPEKTEASGLTASQEARVRELAAAFRLFGDCDAAKGIAIAACERMVYCFYTSALEASDVEGYGRVSVDDANAMLSSIFRGLDFKGIMRTKYDPNADQELFALNDYYYVKRTDGTAFAYEIASVSDLKDEDGNTYGVRVGVDITENGETYGSMELDLVPDENAVYSVVKCATQFAY